MMQPKDTAALFARLSALPPAKRRFLAERLREKGIAVAQLGILRQPRTGEAFPLTHTQERLWFLQALDPESVAYHIWSFHELVGEPLDEAALRRAFADLLRRHETLRTRIELGDDDLPVQRIAGEAKLPLPRIDLDRLEPRRRLREAVRLRTVLGAQPFDLARDLPLHLLHVRLGENDHVIFVALHHIISDAWSVAVLHRDLTALYNAARGRPAAALPALPIQYADFACWQRDWQQPEILEPQLGYWREQLADLPGPPELPMDRPRSASVSDHGAAVTLTLPGPLVGRLKDVARREGATFFMALAALYKVLLLRFGGSSDGGGDSAVGTPIAGRTREEFENLIGYFANTLILRTRLGGNPDFREVLRRLRRVVVEAQDHQDLAFARLVQELRPERSLAHAPLVQVGFAMVTTPEYAGTESWNRFDAPNRSAIFDLHLEMLERPSGDVTGFLYYRVDLFDRTTILRLRRACMQLLGAVLEDPARGVLDLPLLDRAQRHHLLSEHNDTARRRGGSQMLSPMLHSLVLERAAATPDAAAVEFADRVLSYGELARRAASLAEELRRRGAGMETRVAILAERSPELVVALLAVLLADGAWVPLDVEDPPSRLAAVLETLGLEGPASGAAPLVLAQPHLQGRLPSEGVEIVELPTAPHAVPSDSRSVSVEPRSGDGRRLAYAIFTSGSTGRPKGAANTHEAIVNRLLWMQEAYALGPADRVLQKTPISFDVSVWEFFWPLLTGARLVLARPGAHRDPEELAELIAERGITTVHFVPSMLRAFVEVADLEGRGRTLRRILASGEALTPDLAARCRERLGTEGGRALLDNLYGPTEAAIDVSRWPAFAVAPGGSFAATVPIGRPIANLSLHVLDAAGRPAPLGVVGELFLGGVGLARGYLARPARTAAAFVPDPFAASPGARLYRSGDLTRRRRDGEIEYLGRRDHQVKVRGVRIELGEIEAALNAHPAVREAAVTVDRDPTSGARLTACLTAASGQAAPSPAVLREDLARVLPGAMVPSFFVVVEDLPRLTSGKIDRKALAEIAAKHFEAEDGRAARLGPGGVAAPPSNASERTLAAIWRDLLGVDEVGVHDNFFELGGDSILSLQMVFRAGREGLQLLPRQVFEAPTIAGLVALAGSAEIGAEGAAEQVEASGELPLTPIQHWFFEQATLAPHHFNQAVLLRLRPAPAPRRLARALAEVLRHHDALRCRFPRSEDASGVTWRARIEPPEAMTPPLLELDLAALPDARRRAALGRIVARVQASFTLDAPPLLRAVLATAGEGGEALLVLVVHHLVIDGVSWRILLDDLAAAYQGAALPPKTTPYRAWALHLRELAGSEEIAQDAAWWRSTAAGDAPLPVDDPAAPNRAGDARTLFTRFPAEWTRDLLERAPAAYRAGVEDLLLTALARAVAAWSGESALLVDLEGHGRETARDDLDLSRTVGWFTSVHPLRLDLADAASADAAIKAVKEQIRAVPRRGVGFGAARYLSSEAAALAELPRPEMSFNYLGRLDRGGGAASGAPSKGDGRLRLELVGDAPGPVHAPAEERRYLFEVGAGVTGGALGLSLTFGPRHRGEVARRLLDAVAEELRGLVEHCLAIAALRLTPSDVPLAGLDQAGLDRIAADAPALEDIYPLSPLQEGILFHSIYTARSRVYDMQLTCTLRGALDPAAFERAWQRLVDRHDVLRTSFFWQELERPLQAVHRRVALPFRVEDWRGTEAAEARRREQAFRAEDLARGFDLAVPPLQRVALLRLEDDVWRLVWTHHHLQLDGWSLPILFGELFQLYAAEAWGAELDLAPRRPFRDYIAWLEGRDRAAEEERWRERLGGFTTPTPLPLASPAAERGGAVPNDVDSLDETDGDPPTDRLFAHLDPERTAALRALGRRLGVTLSTLTQAAWAVLLGRFAGVGEVVFGATVSGRPAELAGSEAMLGLFINTLPMRVALPDGAPISTWLADVQRELAAARVDEAAPLARIQALSEVPRGRALFESLVVFENYPVATALDPAGDSGGASPRGRLQIDDVESAERTSFPLALQASPGDTLDLRLGFERRRYDRLAARRLLNAFERLLGGMAADPEASLGALSLLGKAETHQLLREWSDTAAPSLAPADALLHRGFERWARRAPDRPALLFGDLALSYGELERRANRLAHRLRAVGVGPEERVGVHAGRSPELVVALLAVLKAGGCYVPLAADLPRDRLAFLLEDAAPRAVVVEPSLLAGLPPSAATTVVLDAASMRAGSLAEDTPPEVSVDPLHPCYVIYTSGSTGKPKGVLIPHRAAAERVGVTAATLEEGEGFLQRAAFSFDLSVAETFAPLLGGGHIVLAPPGSEQDVALLSSAVADQRVGHVGMTTQMLAVLIDGGLPATWRHLRTLSTGGDVVPPDLPARIHQRFGRPLEVYNRYGPTETTISVLAHRCPPGVVPGRLPIGRPLPRVEALVADSRLRLVAHGVDGELLLGGSYLARGYLDRPALTAEKFIPHPHPSFPLALPGARLYRTGDRVRRRADGAIDFLGRIDHQIKIRGFRVELGEIEAVLETHAMVREAAVTVSDEGPSRRLVAYVEKRAHAGDAPDDRADDPATMLRALVAERLPGHMVPSVVLVFDALPRMSSGKVDRRRLPAPPSARDPQRAGRAPATALEKELAAVWTRVLQLDRLNSVDSLGVEENFFELGGDSILSLRVVSEAARRGLTLTPKQLFEHPTVAELAEILEAEGAQSVGDGTAGPAIADPPPDAPLVDLDAEQIARLVGEAPGDVEDIYPLTSAQQGMLFHRLFDPRSKAYFVQVSQILRGGLDPAALRGAWEEAIAAHPVLRTRFVWEGLEEPLQIVVRRPPSPWEEQDWRSKDVAARQRELAAFGDLNRERGFDLSRPPVRLTLIRLDETSWFFNWSYHHILLDGWSAPLLREEIFERYLARLRGIAARPAARPPFREFVAWLRRLDGQAAENFWRRELAGYREPISIGLEAATTARPRGEELHWGLPSALDPATSEAVRRRAASLGITLNTLAQGAWALLLARAAGRSDVLFGATVAGRSAPIEGIYTLLGMCINTLAVRIDVGLDQPVKAWLRAFQDTQARAREHEHVSLLQIRKWCEVPSTLQLFESLVVFENYPRDRSFGAAEDATPDATPAAAPAAPAAPIGRVASERIATFERVSYPLTLVVDPSDDGILLGLGVDARFFDEAFARRLLATFRLLFEGLAERAEARLGEVSLLREAERQAILRSWNPPPVERPGDAPVHRLVMDRARACPDAAALVWERGGESCCWTYGELACRVDALAIELRRRGAGVESRVAILAERSPEMVVALLAVLEAGAAYVPLDPRTPPERLAFCLEDSAAILVLAGSALVDAARRAAPGVAVLDLEAPREPVDGASMPPPDPRNAAYLIYTSGSTGRPKAVTIEHRSLVDYSLAAAEAVDLGPGDRVLQFASLSFDTSAEEIFPCLLRGAALVLRDDAMLEPAAFLAAAERLRLTVLDLPTAYWHELTRHLDAEAARSPAVPPSLRLVILGGEKAEAERLAAWARRVGELPRLINTYGPTEATIVAVQTPLLGAPSPRPTASGSVWPRVPIGAPRANARAHVLGPGLEPLPPGFPGQLHLGGAGLARGYHGRPALTAAAFIPDPFAERPGERLYRSGDRASYREDGRIDFLGRVDRQVKLRGFRVELGEIESALAKLPGVREAAVAVHQGGLRGDGVGVLTAWVEAERSADWRRELAERLPSYMVPSVVVEVGALPRTPSGKLDRRALLATAIDPAAVGADQAVHEAPRGEFEILLAKLWGEIFGGREVDRRDDFFALGGDSLLALRLIGGLRRELGREISLATLFDRPVLADLAAHLERGEEAEAGLSGGRPAVALGSAPRPGREQGAAPLFLVHPAGGEILAYRELAARSVVERPIYGLRAPGLEEGEEILTTTEAMAERYLAAVREIRPTGPVLLGGWSLGGTVAWEMACRRAARGEESAVILLDTVAPELLSGWSDEELHEQFARLARVDAASVADAEGTLKRLWRVYEATVRAAETYAPPPFDGPVLLVRADGDSDLGWGAHARRLEIVNVPGAIHQNLLEPPHVDRVHAAVGAFCRGLTS